MRALKTVVAIVNQKGGVGKSTTAINLAAYLADKGEKILVVDMDPQGNATSGLGVSPDSNGCMYDVLLDGRPLQDRSEEHTSELQSRQYLVCRLLLEKKKPLSTLSSCII